jgi:hypothetical protein
MNHRLVALLIGAAVLPIHASATENGVVMRRTELRQAPFDDAARIAELAERAPVRLLTRQGGWLQVQATPHTGWLRLLFVRTTPAESPPASAAASSLQAAINLARTGSSGQTVATGVRGLDRADLARATPNPARVAQLDAMAVSRDEAEAFGQVAQKQPPPPTPVPGGRSG